MKRFLRLDSQGGRSWLDSEPPSWGGRSEWEESKDASWTPRQGPNSRDSSDELRPCPENNREATLRPQATCVILLSLASGQEGNEMNRYTGGMSQGQGAGSGELGEGILAGGLSCHPW